MSVHTHNPSSEPRAQFNNIHWFLLGIGLFLGLSLVATSLGLAIGLKSVFWASLLGYLGVFTTVMIPYGFVQMKWLYEGKMSGWKKFLTKWYGVFGFIWAFPITFFVYICYIGPMQMFGQYRYVGRWGWLFEFETIKGQWIDEKFWKGKWGGTSSGSLIIYNGRYSDVDAFEDIHDHERHHSWQAFVLGIWIVLIYAIHLITLLLSGKKPFDAYHNVIIEAGARRAEDQDE